MKILGCAFDLEGTLVDVEAVHHQGHVRAAEEVGLKVTVEEAVQRFPHFIGGPDREIAREIWEAAGGRSTVEEILSSTRRYYEDFMETMGETLWVGLRPGARDVLDFLFRKGVLLAIGSNTEWRFAKVLVERSGLGEVIPIDRMVFADHVQSYKPAPDVFLKTAERMGILPEYQLVFDDSPCGIEAAIAAGSIAIGMPIYAGQEKTLLGAGAKGVYRSWSDVRVAAEILLR